MKNFIRQHEIFLTSILAAIAYGGWAVFANFEYGAKAAFMAGIVQAVYAFLATMSVSKIAHMIFRKCDCGYKGICLGFLASFIVMVCIPFAVHSFAGTPDIVETILPGLIIGSLYLITYLAGLHIREEKKKSMAKSNDH